MYVRISHAYVRTYCENRSLIQSLMLMCPAISIVRFELQSGVVCLGAKGTLAPLPPSAMTRLTELVLEGCLGKHSPYVAMPCIGSDPQCPLYLQLQNETLVALVQVVYADLWVCMSWFHSLDIIPHSILMVCFSGASYLLSVLRDGCLPYYHLDPDSGGTRVCVWCYVVLFPPPPPPCVCVVCTCDSDCAHS